MFVNHALTSSISKLPYLSNQAVFSAWPKSQDLRFKYLENENEIKSIFHHFWRVSIEVNNKIFLEGESPTLSQADYGNAIKFFKYCQYNVTLGILAYCFLFFSLVDISPFIAVGTGSRLYVYKTLRWRP